jgi:endonuclease/exonuclease/phosphatase family metal-dependent hydrolase
MKHYKTIHPMKQTFLFLLLLAGLCACSNKPEPWRIMTFNIRYDNPEDSLNNWRYRKDAAAGIITEYDIDLLGAQEVLFNQLHDLLDRLLGYAAIGVGRMDGEQAGEYAPIFYKKEKFEVEKSGYFWLSETPEIPGSKGWDGACERIATWAVLKDKTTQQRLFFMNTHLDHVGQVARREGVKLLLERAETLRDGLPAIITGDFNASPESEVIKQVIAGGKFYDSRSLAGAQHVSPLPDAGGTFHSFGEIPAERRKTIDYIFITAPAIVHTYQVAPEKREGVFLSDHAPVYVEVSIKK